MGTGHGIERRLCRLIFAACLLHSIRYTHASYTAQQQQQTEILPRSISSIPRSNNSNRPREPPWNPSPHIDADGFLANSYVRAPGEWEQEVTLKTSITTDLPCIIRQVPGDGNCLFHSVSLCLYQAEHGEHWNIQTPGELDKLYEQSKLLRSRAVKCLRQSRRRLFLQGRESLKAYELVQAAAQQYGLTPEEYCEAMRVSRFNNIIVLGSLFGRHTPLLLTFLDSHNAARTTYTGGMCLGWRTRDSCSLQFASTTNSCL
jgi:hypothetical protein